MIVPDILVKPNADPSRELLGYIVRHGELNLQDNRWDGWGPYVLSPEGKQAAENAGQWLAYERFGRLVSSDLPRVLQSAEIILDAVNIECPYIVTDPNLRAWAIGDFTGKEKTEERKEKLQYYRDHPDEIIPNGESWNMLYERVKVAFQYLCSPYKALPTIIVTHNSVIKALMGLDEKGDIVHEGGIVACYMNSKGDFDFKAVLGATELDKSVGLESSCG